MRAYKRRDLTIIEQENDGNLVITCDSCGGIGLKEGDVFKLSPFYVGKFTTRVALLELISSGATPIALSSGVSCEMEPTGKEILRGIKEELDISGWGNVAITGSSEENFASCMTAVGLTMLGIAKKNELLFKKGISGDKIILFGEPRMGEKVDLEDNSIYKTLGYLKSNINVKEIVPVGSKGVLYEAVTIGAIHNLKFIQHLCSTDLYASAGPSSCMIALSCVEIEGGILIGEMA